MKKEKWVAIISGLLMLLCFPLYFLYFIDYRLTRAINNDKLIAAILFIPFIIDAIILFGCRGRDASRPRTYRVLYFSNLIVFIVLLVSYLLIIFATDGFNTDNFS